MCHCDSASCRASPSPSAPTIIQTHPPAKFLRAPPLLHAHNTNQMVKSTLLRQKSARVSISFWRCTPRTRDDLPCPTCIVNSHQSPLLTSGGAFFSDCSCRYARTAIAPGRPAVNVVAAVSTTDPCSPEPRLAWELWRRQASRFRLRLGGVRIDKTTAFMRCPGALLHLYSSKVAFDT